MPTPRSKRSQRHRGISTLSFGQRDESGRGFIVQSIHSTKDLFQDDDKYEIHPLDRSNSSNRSAIPFNKPIEAVYYGVHDGPVLGYGISGLIRKITNKETGDQFAVKKLNLAAVDSDEARLQLIEEIDIMCQLDHPNIVQLEEIYESNSVIYLVLELCHGGELFQTLDKQEDFHFNEEQTASLVKQILSAVTYLHAQGIVHRDLKLENFLFSTNDPSSELKMIDFGLSKHFKYDDVHSEKVGTPYTVAPEVIKGSYDARCDVWGIGVITYLLLCGDSPFGGCDASGMNKSLAEIRNNILSGVFKFEPENIWEDVSQDAKDFVTALLNANPEERPSARQIRNLSFLRKYDVSPSSISKNTNNTLCGPCFSNPILAPIIAKLSTAKKVGFEPM